MLVRFISKIFATSLIVKLKSLFVKRARAILTRVVRSEHLTRFFFKKLNFHSELSDHLFKRCSFFSFNFKLFSGGVFAGSLKYNGSLLEEFAFPGTQKARLDPVLHCQDAELLLSLEGLNDEVAFEAGRKSSTFSGQGNPPCCDGRGRRMHAGGA